MKNKKEIKSYYDIELEEQSRIMKKEKKTIKQEKDTIINRIKNNIGLFILIIISILILFKIYGTFYTITMAFGFPIPMIDKYSIPGSVTADDKMYVTSVIFIIISLLGVIYIFKKRYIENKKNNKWSYKGLATIIFGGYILFLLVNPGYAWQKYPKIFFYENGQNITNKSLYFFMTERYGFKSSLYKPFKTLEESIDGLEFAKKIKEPSLYNRIFGDTKKFGYNNLLKRYNDDSFQLYFLNYILFTSTFYDGKINNLDDSLTYLKSILSVTKNSEIINLSNELLNKLNYASKLNEKEMKQVMDTYLKEYLDKIFNTKTVDKSIFL